MKIEQILMQANLKCNDTIDANTLLIYLNQGIMKLNLEVNVRLPLIEMKDAPNEYIVSDDEFVNQIVASLLVSFVASCIRQNEGYSNQENTFYSEYLTARMQFATKFFHLIKPEYQLTRQQNGSVVDSVANKVITNKVKMW